MDKKCKYYVYLSKDKATTSIEFEFHDFDDLQNLFGYCVDGCSHVNFEVYKVELEEADD